MTSDTTSRLARAIVSIAAAVVPAGQRDDWHAEWIAELASLRDIPSRHRRPVRRALGAFADAFWLRQRSIADFNWIDDVRHGLRQLVQHGSFAVTAIGILALGLAATVAMFSVTDQILLRPLPYPAADRIVTVWETRLPNDEPLEVSPGNLLDWRDRSTSFEFLAGADPWALDVAGNPRPEVWFSAKITPGFLESFGITPIVGRLFRPEEYQLGGDRVLVIGESFWRQRFAGDRSVVGRSIHTEDGEFTIVGILPDTFEPRVLPTASGHRSIWQPKAIEPFERNIRGSGYWAVVGRLKPGVTVDAAQAELTSVAAQMARDYPKTNARTGARVLALRDHLVGDVRLAVALLAAAVVVVLLIACVNVANLLLARGSAREREIAVRIAVGARRGQIVRQLLLESLVIAALGGLAGAGIAAWGLTVLARLGPASIPWIESLHVDWRALGFAVVMSGVVAIVSGTLPAWRAARGGLAAAGRSSTSADPSQHRLRSGLVIAEVALALVLVSGAGLLLRSFVSLVHVDPGFERDRVMVAQVFAWDHNPKPDQLRTFFETTIARLSALPAVQAAGAVSAMPFIESNINIQNVFTINNRPQPSAGEAPRAFLTVATPGYFDAMRIPLKAGRLLDAHDDRDGKRVAVITEALARQYWPEGDDAIGDTVQFRFSGLPISVEIVGVVGSLRHDRLDRAARAELFMPLAQMPFGSMTFVIRSAGDATGLLAPARTAIWSVDPGQSIYRQATLDELVSKTVSTRRFALAVILGFAAVSLLLSVAGVYGVLSAIMTTRLREVGLRVALGASRRDIVRLVFGRGLAVAGAGLLIGLAGSIGAAQLLRSFLFQITPADPITLAAAGALMAGAALAASYLPARRAALADPISVLRSE